MQEAGREDKRKKRKAGRIPSLQVHCARHRRTFSSTNTVAKKHYTAAAVAAAADHTVAATDGSTQDAKDLLDANLLQVDLLQVSILGHHSKPSQQAICNCASSSVQLTTGVVACRRSRMIPDASDWRSLHNICMLQSLNEQLLVVSRVWGRIPAAPVKWILTEEHGEEHHTSGPNISWLAVVPPLHIV